MMPLDPSKPHLVEVVSEGEKIRVRIDGNPIELETPLRQTIGSFVGLEIRNDSRESGSADDPSRCEIDHLLVR